MLLAIAMLDSCMVIVDACLTSGVDLTTFVHTPGS